MARRRNRRPKSLAGTNLYIDSNGIYKWRRVDGQTRKRIKRSTKTKNLEIALRKAAEFEDEYQRKQAGLMVYDCWTKDIEPLVKEWLDSQIDEIQAPQLKTKRFRMERALKQLKLRTVADLDDIGRLNRRVLELQRDGHTRQSLRRNYQEPLKQFSKWLAANRRHLDRDPLSVWEPIKKGRDSIKRRRAFLPNEVARAFLAVPHLDRFYRRKHSPYMTFLLLLVAGPRAGALISRDIRDLKIKDRRIDFGENVKNKRKGAGALDPKTLEDLLEYIAGRAKAEPLLLSPKGTRHRIERLLDHWRESFSLGILDSIWPPEEDRDINTAILTNIALFKGRVQVNKGGNPKLLKPETIAKRNQLEQKITDLVEALRDEWEERMEGVDVHAFRKTHRSWAEARGVPPVLIDKQLGHSADDTSMLLQMIVGSVTGRKHYLDVDSELFDATRSAKAIRNFLDEAVEAAKQDGDSLFVSDYDVGGETTEESNLGRSDGL